MKYISKRIDALIFKFFTWHSPAFLRFPQPVSARLKVQQLPRETLLYKKSHFDLMTPILARKT